MKVVHLTAYSRRPRTMTFSTLQRYILREAYQSRVKRFPRRQLVRFYERRRSAPKVADRQNNITKSLERLIDKGYLTGYGRRTPRKWFIEEVALTALGRRAGKVSLGEQQALPLRNSKLKMKNVK